MIWDSAVTINGNIFTDGERLGINLTWDSSSTEQISSDKSTTGSSTFVGMSVVDIRGVGAPVTSYSSTAVATLASPYAAAACNRCCHQPRCCYSQESAPPSGAVTAPPAYEQVVMPCKPIPNPVEA